MAAAYCLRRCPGLVKAAILTWMLLTVTAVLAHSDGLVQAAQATDSSTYTLRGTVINSVTGDPIRRVLVQAGPYTQLTDPQGRFEFSGLSAGQFAITVQKPGFFNPGEWAEGSQPTIVDVGPKTPDPVIKLIPEGIIFGHLTDENGEPLEGVFLHTRVWRVINGLRQLQDMGGQTTDEDGYFRLFGLMPGTYYLQAGPIFRRGFFGQMPFSDGGNGYPGTYFPGVMQLSAATAIRVAPGQKVQADFSLHRTRAFQVSGQVASYSGGHVTGVSMRDSSDPSLSFPVDLDPGSGTFTARDVPAGSYIIQASGLEEGQEPSGRQLIGEKEVTVSANLNGIVVSLAAAVSIPVIVLAEFETSSFIGSRNPVMVQLSALGGQGQTYFSQELPSGGSRGDGGLVLPSVLPGRYCVSVNSQGNWYIESVTSGSTDLFREPLTVSSGTEVAPIRVLVRGDGASLAGLVRSDGSPVSAPVLLVMPEEPLRVPQIVISDPQGAFQLTNLPPGDYVVLGFDSTAGLEYADRDSLRDYFSQGTPVTLGPKDAKTISVDVIHR